MDKEYFLNFLNGGVISTFDFMLKYVILRGIEDSAKTREYLAILLRVPILSRDLVDSAIDYCINHFNIITLCKPLEEGGDIIMYY